MKIHTPETFESSLNLLKYLNYCHDGCITRISFLKKREIDKETGSIIYPFDDLQEMIFCDIEIEVILNSYDEAKMDQCILLFFKHVSSFLFAQNTPYDYSDIYEVRLKKGSADSLEFSFYSTNQSMRSLSISCRHFICQEL